MHFQILVLGAFKQLTGGIGLSGRAWVARKILMPPECEASPKQVGGLSLRVRVYPKGPNALGDLEMQEF